MRHARARVVIALSGRRVLAPLVASIFAVVGVFLDQQNSIQSSWALTCLRTMVLTAWAVNAIEREVPSSADAVLTVSIARGARTAWRGRLVLVAALTALITTAFLLWPTCLGAFDRGPQAVDIAAALLAHSVCGAVGGTLVLLFAEPTRTAIALAVTIAAVLGSVALAGPPDRSPAPEP